MNSLMAPIPFVASVTWLELCIILGSLAGLAYARRNTRRRRGDLTNAEREVTEGHWTVGHRMLARNSVRLSWITLAGLTDLLLFGLYLAVPNEVRAAAGVTWIPIVLALGLVAAWAGQAYFEDRWHQSAMYVIGSLQKANETNERNGKRPLGDLIEVSE